MGYPTKYTRQYDYVSYQNSNPTRPLPADKVNIDLNTVAATTSEIVEFLKGFSRADGSIANSVVGYDQLSGGVQALLGLTNSAAVAAAIDGTTASAVAAAASATAATGSATGAATSATAAAGSATAAAGSATGASASATAAQAASVSVAGVAGAVGSLLNSASIPTTSNPVVVSRVSTTQWTMRTPLVGGVFGEYVEYDIRDIGPVMSTTRCLVLNGVLTNENGNVRVFTDGTATGGSVFEYAMNTGLMADAIGTWAFYGNGHGFVTYTGLSVTMDGGAELRDMATGTIVKGMSGVVSQTFDIRLPKDNTTVIGTINQAHIFTAAGCLVSHVHTPTVGTTGVQNAYDCMLPVSGCDRVKFGSNSVIPVVLGTGQSANQGQQSLVQTWNSARPDLVLEVNRTLPTPDGWTNVTTSDTFYIAQSTYFKIYFNYRSGTTGIATATSVHSQTYRVTKAPLTTGLIDTDVALTANSDLVVPSQKAIKTFANTKATKSGTNTFVGDQTITGNIVVSGNITTGDGSTFGGGGTAVGGLGRVFLDGSSGNNGGAALYIRRNGTNKFAFGNYSAILGGTSDDFVVYSLTAGGGTKSAIKVGSADGVVTIADGTATPAGGSVTARLLFGSTAGFGVYYGSGVPTVSAGQGSIYLRSDGSSTSTRMYVNTNGTTGWTAVTTAT